MQHFPVFSTFSDLYLILNICKEIGPWGPTGPAFATTKKERDISHCAQTKHAGLFFPPVFRDVEFILLDFCEKSFSKMDLSQKFRLWVVEKHGNLIITIIIHNLKTNGMPYEGVRF